MGDRGVKKDGRGVTGESEKGERGDRGESEEGGVTGEWERRGEG